MFISKIIKEIQPYLKLFVDARAAFKYFMVSQGQVKCQVLKGKSRSQDEFKISQDPGLVRTSVKTSVKS